VVTITGTGASKDKLQIKNLLLKTTDFPTLVYLCSLFIYPLEIHIFLLLSYVCLPLFLAYNNKDEVLQHISILEFLYYIISTKLLDASFHQVISSQRANIEVIQSLGNISSASVRFTNRKRRLYISPFMNLKRMLLFIL
jgi:hypothetical protein